MTRNYILLSGGPGLYDPLDPEHDQSWANYVTPPLQQTRTRRERNSFQAADEEVWWFVYRPAYERRWTDDQQRADRRHEPQRVMGLDCGGRLCRSYIDLLEYRARTRGWNLRWISSADDFWRRLRSFRDPISRVRYWGHAQNDLWLSLHHDSAHRAVAPDADEIIRVSDIHQNSALQSRFQAGSSSRRHIFSGCNTHTFASEWARVFRVYARGYEGTLRFTTATQTGTTPGAGCILHNYAPGGSAEALHEAASSSETLDHRQGALQDTTTQVASERDTFAESAHAAGMPVDSAFPDPEELYGEIMYNGHGPRSALAENLTVLARPGESLEAPPQAGDILLRVAVGEPGLGYMAVLSDSRLWSDQQLANAPFRAESRAPGFYAPVVESGVFPHTRGDPFARRLLDAEGRLLPGQLLLSPRPSVDGEDGYAQEEATYTHEEPALDEALWLELEGAEGGESSSLRQRIVEIAKREWERWDRGNKSETDPAVTGYLQTYYARGVGGRVTRADLRNPTWQSRHPWSAVFISYVMREAGAGDAFAYARAHTRYIAAAKRAAQARDTSKFQAFDITAVRPEAGDLVCRDRQRGSGAPCAGTNFANVDRGGISHSDIVVEVHPDYIVALGGNTGQSFPTRGRGSNTVGQKRVRLDARGFVVPNQSRCRYFAIVKPPSEVRPTPSTLSSSDPASGLPAWLAGAVRAGRLTLQAARAMLSGQRDVNALTNVIFYAQNPHLPVGYKIKPHERELARQWLRIRDDTVKPLLRRLADGPSSAPSPRSQPASTPTGPTAAEALAPIIQAAASSEIARYRWRDRGVAPPGYIKGMALVYAKVYCKLKAGDAAAREMAKANTGNVAKDALALYDPEFRAVGMRNDVDGVDTLRHLFVLLIGHGMRESSGQYCEGRDRSAQNTKATTAEAGLFQTSYNLIGAHPTLRQLFSKYLANPSGFLDVFQEGVTCSRKDRENFGTGQGREFQRLSKACPAFAAEFTAVGLRHRMRHWGPVRRKWVEIVPACDAMLLRVQRVVDEFNLCPALR